MSHMEKVLRRSRWNSGVLAFMFLTSGIRSMSEGSVFGMAIGLVACGFVVMDVFAFTDALKIWKQAEKEIENGESKNS